MEMNIRVGNQSPVNILTFINNLQLHKLSDIYFIGNRAPSSFRRGFHLSKTVKEL